MATAATRKRGRKFKKKPWSLQDPGQLEGWYKSKIEEGTSLFDIECKAVVNTVVRALQNHCSSYGILFDVDETIKSGSQGKGTMVKNLSDLDLVVFINPPVLPSILEVGPQRYRGKLTEVLKNMEKILRSKRVPRISSKGIKRDSFRVYFRIRRIGVKGHRQSLKVDLLPTADNGLGPNHCSSASDERQRLSAMFNDMLRQSDDDREYYSVSLVKYQKKFVKKKPPPVKDLIRVVKYWMYTRLPEDLKKSYPLELITIYCWERARSPTSFSMAQGLKAVLLLLSDISKLRSYWTEFYDDEMAEEAITQLDMERPILLDPANPTNNVCKLYHGATSVQKAAVRVLQAPLFLNTEVCPKWAR